MVAIIATAQKKLGKKRTPVPRKQHINNTNAIKETINQRRIEKLKLITKHIKENY